MNKGINFRHYRKLDTRTPTYAPDVAPISSRGGATLAYTDSAQENGTMDFAGAVAYCGPKDNFAYEYGRAKSRGRLVQFMSSSNFDTLNDTTHVGGNKTFLFTDTTRDQFLREMDAVMSILGYVRR